VVVGEVGRTKEVVFSDYDNYVVMSRLEDETIIDELKQ
jgi:hypothetical protein